MFEKIRQFLFGPPKDVHDKHTFHSLSLIAMLAWVGLGADGLSSSAYGPDEAFRQLTKDGHDYTSLAVGLAVGTALTVFIISYAYSRVIEHFPSGGGGYVVATKLLGPRFGVVSGLALLVDYVLTITTSIAAGGDALFNMVPRPWFGAAAMQLREGEIGTWGDPVQRFKVGVELAATVTLTVLNIRGVRESVTAILPIFALFVVTHAIVLLVAIGGHFGDIGAVAHVTSMNYAHTVASLGAFGTMALLVRAYSLGGGTYTGIEAVSNGVGIMREPKVRTAKRTMVLMATSLSITAGGIILSYLLVHAVPVEGKTMNAVLLENLAGELARRRLERGRDVHVRLPRERGRPPPHRRAGRLRRWAARHGEHGGRLVATAPLRRPVRAPQHAERRPHHGRHVRRGVSAFTTSACPLNDAPMSGVRPPSALAFGSAWSAKSPRTASRRWSVERY